MGAFAVKRVTVFSLFAISIVLIVLVALFIVYPASPNEAKKDQKTFYVGVTFGGSTSAEAKQLIDKVKDYTNLFVVASGSMQNDITELENTCDYAVKSELDIIVYFGSYQTQSFTTAPFIETAQERWGSHFLGIYYGDEPGGKMLDGDRDSRIDLGDVPNLGNVEKYSDRVKISQTNGSIITSKEFTISGEYSGQITLNYGNITISYYTDGIIHVSNYTDPQNPEFLTYLPNGTVTLQKGVSTVTISDRGNISQFEPYQELWNSRPFQTANDAATVATAYVNAKQASTSWIRNQSHVNIFTSDYALYWWDYQGGYDTVFAQLGWNNTVAQEIGLVRGAANLQGKSWGTILTWKYTQAPYLASGDELFDQMKASYESGAEYVVVFNYAEDMIGQYGTLQEQHFQALERFWNDVVQNPNVVHGGVKAEAALVLPKNYGWGMRNPTDRIWGLWNTNSTSEQIWTQLQNKLAQYGSRIDIVYDDPANSVAGKYPNIYYWNQTG